MSKNQSKPLILMVDDDLELSDLYKTRLEMEGFRVEHVADGEKALVAAANLKPDLILLDIMLPKMSGLDALKLMRGKEATRDLKIVVFTALGQLEDRQQALTLGANDYWVKSEITLIEMIPKIWQLLKQPTVHHDGSTPEH